MKSRKRLRRKDAVGGLPRHWRDPLFLDKLADHIQQGTASDLERVQTALILRHFALFFDAPRPGRPASAALRHARTLLAAGGGLSKRRAARTATTEHGGTSDYVL